MPMSKVESRQLDLAGCVPVDDSIQAWRSVVESARHGVRMTLWRGGVLNPESEPPSGLNTPPHQGVILTPSGSGPDWLEHQFFPRLSSIC